MSVGVQGPSERETLLLRGTLDMCVLAVLAARPLHAYGVVQHLQQRGFDQTTYGTIYPLVTRLRKQALVEQQGRPGQGGPSKNVLSITALGRAALQEWQKQWHDNNARVLALLTDSAPQE
jgi:PadR family transcriptional regulator PadR